jgi:hypothetical protein
MMKLHIKGDGSYLGIVDINEFNGYVGSDWAENPRLLEPHFIEHMQKYAGLFWDTNLESDWVVEVAQERSDRSGFREFSAPLKVTNGKAAFLNYDSLTMLAQFEDEDIEKHIGDNLLDIENGDYNIRVIQLKDPELVFPDGTSTDFLIEITKTDSFLPLLSEVPWSRL